MTRFNHHRTKALGNAGLGGMSRFFVQRSIHLVCLWDQRLTTKTDRVATLPLHKGTLRGSAQRLLG